MGQPCDGRIDQYALGVTVFEILAGRRPFQGATGTATLVMQTTQPAPDLRSVAPRVPPAVSDAVARALAKEPSARFPTCAGFATAVVAGGGRPGPVVSRRRRRARRVGPCGRTRRGWPARPVGRAWSSDRACSPTALPWSAAAPRARRAGRGSPSTPPGARPVGRRRLGLGPGHCSPRDPTRGRTAVADSPLPPARESRGAGGDGARIAPQTRDLGEPGRPRLDPSPRLGDRGGGRARLHRDPRSRGGRLPAPGRRAGLRATEATTAARLKSLPPPAQALGRLELDLSDVPPHAVLRLDGSRETRERLDRGIAVPVGPHLLSVEGAGPTEYRQTFIVAADTRASFKVDFPAPETVAAATVPRRETPPPRPVPAAAPWPGSGVRPGSVPGHPLPPPAAACRHRAGARRTSGRGRRAGGSPRRPVGPRAAGRGPDGSVRVRPARQRNSDGTVTVRVARVGFHVRNNNLAVVRQAEEARPVVLVPRFRKGWRSTGPSRSATRRPGRPVPSSTTPRPCSASRSPGASRGRGRTGCPCSARRNS